MLLPFLTLGVECEWGSARSLDHGSGSGSSDGVTDVEASLLSTAVFLGMLIGALTSGLLSDRLGRRPAVLLFTACTGLFGLWSALAHSFRVLVLCRALVGVGVGGSPAALALFTEFLPKQKRGAYLINYMCYFSAGAVVEVVLAWLVLNAYGWRCLLFLSCLPALALVVLVWLFLPESAGWLLAQGRRREAAAILQSAYCANHPQIQHEESCELDQFAHGQLDANELIPCHCGGDDRTAAPSTSSQNGGVITRVVVVSSSRPDEAAESLATNSSVPCSRSCTEPLFLVFSPELRSMSLLLCLLFFLMAFTYYGLVLMSLTMVQDQHHHDQCTLRHDQYAQLLTANLAEFPGLLMCFLLLDRIGRRLTITYMFLGTALCTALIPALWSLQSCSLSVAPPVSNGVPIAAGGSPPLVCTSSPLADWLQSILLFGARACSLAFNQSLWIYTAELFPAQVRSSGLGVTTVFARIGGGLSPWVCQWLYWRHRYLAVYSCVGAACLAAGIAARMPNDTRGMQLDVLVEKRTPAHSSHLDARRAIVTAPLTDSDSSIDDGTTLLLSTQRLAQHERVAETERSTLASLNLDVLRAPLPADEESSLNLGQDRPAITTQVSLL